ncbi:signal recognition particle 14 kDa protein-like [Stylophora pistillata]|uniref:Signal recognition particle 14 kDa protein n=1 Tax=Stylophora pistillata TaxID=50429 RepID=A0A2B4RWU3_STYPI|nr:signal recognition particle 14 kDa protein-like [Stylophora pistillata]PFX20715.1 Signal recognition particle 14 kDa protein [Stylophora pistillata]
MVLLDNDGFLTQLTLLLQKTRSSGTVNITMKRYYGQTKPKPKPRGGKKLQKLTAVEQEGDSRCLFRATNGKKKLSTVVNSKDVNRFQMAYANVLKANMDNLKKRDRRTEKNKAKKSKATQ